MAPVLVTWPVLPPSIRMPMALSTSLKVIDPSLVTTLLLLRVTAAPATVGLIDPLEVMSMSSGRPPLAVAVVTGWVVEVVIWVAAWTYPAVAANSGATATAAARNLRFIKVKTLDSRRVFAGLSSAQPNTSAIGRLSRQSGASRRLSRQDTSATWDKGPCRIASLPQVPWPIRSKTRLPAARAQPWPSSSPAPPAWGRR